MTQIKNNFIESIGNTPLIKLKAASEITGCNIYGKAEYLNPGGSVKDRAALALIKDAQEKKLISEGGIVVEGTAGNTGIGLAVVCKEYDCDKNEKMCDEYKIDGYPTIKMLKDGQTIDFDAKPTIENLTSFVESTL
mgnify:CR=1 FL=1